MKTSVVSLRIEEGLKQKAAGRARRRGTTLTFVITKCLRAYARGELPAGLLGEREGIEVAPGERGGGNPKGGPPRRRRA